MPIGSGILLSANELVILIQRRDFRPSVASFENLEVQNDLIASSRTFALTSIPRTVREPKGKLILRDTICGSYCSDGFSRGSPCHHEIDIHRLTFICRYEVDFDEIRLRLLVFGCQDVISRPG
jgi:hypothetical protein